MGVLAPLSGFAQKSERRHFSRAQRCGYRGRDGGKGRSPRNSPRKSPRNSPRRGRRNSPRNRKDGKSRSPSRSPKNSPRNSPRRSPKNSPRGGKGGRGKGGKKFDPKKFKAPDPCKDFWNGACDNQCGKVHRTREQYQKVVANAHTQWQRRVAALAQQENKDK